MGYVVRDEIEAVVKSRDFFDGKMREANEFTGGNNRIFAVDVGDRLCA